MMIVMTLIMGLVCIGGWLGADTGDYVKDSLEAEESEHRQHECDPYCTTIAECFDTLRDPLLAFNRASF